MRNLTRSARGTAAAPGVRVAQKCGLNRAIADQGWATFVTILRDQAASAGLPVIAVPAHGTSQTCSRCGADVPKTLSVRRHRCPHCGLDLDRDHNAAICILRRAWPAHGRGLADVPPPGHGRAGRVSRVRCRRDARHVKRGVGPVRGMTVSMSTQGYKPPYFGPL